MNAPHQTKRQNLDLALIGNSCSAALVDRNARIVWWCFPYFDSDPVFSRLLADDEEKGFCDVTVAGLVETELRYMRNTAIVETIMTDARGAKLRIADFAPRFDLFEREYRAPQIIRRIEPLAGLPRIAIRVRPTHNYGRPTTNAVVGSNHVRYVGGPHVMRLTTDAPLSYVVNEITFPLTRPVNLIFGQDEPFLTAIDTTSREFLDRTRDHWLTWVRNLAVPFEWQAMVVRAAITLRLCSFQETGAIVAAHTTSLPEAPSSSRTWDYRYCWLRDAYFVVDALNRLGATRIMESYINYITTIATDSEDVRPVHRIVPFSSLEERSPPTSRAFSATGRFVSATRLRARRRTTSMAASFSPQRRCSSTNACRKWATRRFFGCLNLWANVRSSGRSSPTPDYGNIARLRAPTPIPRCCAGRPAIGWRGSRGGSTSPTAPSIGGPTRTSCARGFSVKPGMKNGAR